MKNKFLIHAGDYIDSREFTREECERFCELAVECGFGRGEWVNCVSRYYWKLGVCIKEDEVYSSQNDYFLRNNITTKFREFLDKEKGMGDFTKYNLNSGYKVTYRNGLDRIVLLSWLVFYTHDIFGGGYKIKAELNSFNDDLTHCDNRDLDIMKVTDSDGTVLFEREPEPKEMTVADIEKALGYSVKVVK